MIELVLVPAGRGCFDVLVDGETIAAAARVPVCEGAREMLARGVDPDSVLVARHAGSAVVAMRGTVGGFAKLTVKENSATGPKWEKWTPFNQDTASRVRAASPASVLVLEAAE